MTLKIGNRNVKGGDKNKRREITFYFATLCKKL